MNERIKEVRKARGLSQDEFGRRLGVTRGAVTNIELNKVEPKPLFVDLICREFDVNREWLRTGAGPMFVEKSRDEELAELFCKVLAGDPDFRQRLLSAMPRLTEEQWAMLEEVAQRLASDIEAQKDPGP